MKKALVVGGLGKVGSAVVKALSPVYETFILDIEAPKPDLKSVDFLHVCIPYHGDFSPTVKEIGNEYKAKNIIVHSTVPVGTTRKIGENAAHSPVRGQHNALDSSLFRFVKYVGAVDPSRTSVFLEHLKDIGINAQAMPSPEATELLKMLCLSRLLNDLAFLQTTEKMLKAFGVPKETFERWTETYNEGYKTKFVRPELDFPNGAVGGSCVLQVSKMLVQQTADAFLKRNVQMFSPDF